MKRPAGKKTKKRLPVSTRPTPKKTKSKPKKKATKKVVKRRIGERRSAKDDATITMHGTYAAPSTEDLPHVEAPQEVEEVDAAVVAAVETSDDTSATDDGSVSEGGN